MNDFLYFLFLLFISFSVVSEMFGCRVEHGVRVRRVSRGFLKDEERFRGGTAAVYGSNLWRPIDGKSVHV